MKIEFLLFSILFIILLPETEAQEAKHRLGLEGGPSVTRLWGDHHIPQNYETGKGLYGGLTYNYRINSRLLLCTGIGYEKKGAEAMLTATDGSGTPTGEIESRLGYNYIIVPALGKVSFGKNIRLFLKAGLFLGKMLSVNSITEAGDLVPETKLDVSEYTRGGDFGLTSGVGADLPLNELLSLSLELRTNLGLVDTNKNQAAGNGSIRTVSTNLLLGISYNLPVKMESGKQ
jgi:hypothetical protein